LAIPRGPQLRPEHLITSQRKDGYAQVLELCFSNYLAGNPFGYVE